jgi:hypothetical protein
MLDRERGAIGHELQQRDRLGVERGRGERADMDHPEHPPGHDERHTEQ